MGAHDFLAMLLEKISVTGQMEVMENDIKPLPEQYAITPGDKVIVVTGGSSIDKDLTVGEVQDPEAEEWKARFPDYETRLANSFVLMTWRSAHDPRGDVGWFSRVRLLPISEERYTEMVEWFTNSTPQVPKWTVELFEEYTKKIHQHAPENIPSVVSCEKCGKNNTEIHVSQLHKLSSRVGQLVKDGKPYYVTISDHDVDHKQIAHLHCNDCGSRKPISEEAYSLNAHASVKTLG